MASPWTNEQWEAITSRGSNLLVSAAAGSGKTAVLVERIIRMITEDGVDIDTLLVMTFTNAAAAEMRERIGSAVIKALDANPGDKNLERQLSLLGRSSITTIHSFCLEVIRNNFHLIGLDPGFRIADETEATLLKEESLDETLEEFYDRQDPDFLDLSDAYGGKKDDRDLIKTVYEVHRHIMSSPWPEAWLREKVGMYQVEGKKLLALPVLKGLLQDLQSRLQIHEEALEKALDIIDGHEPLQGYSEALRADQQIFLGLKALLEEESDYDSLRNYLMTISWARMKPAKKNADPQAVEEVKGIREDFKKFIKALTDKYFGESEENNLAILQRTYPRLKALEAVILRFMEVYSRRKRDKGLLDFNDLEHLALEILSQEEDGRIVPSETALEYKKRFQEVLVDEYQDSNEVQEVLITMVSRKNEDNPNVFMVGDVKQSIYRFRQARPELFMEKYRTYSPEGNAQGKKIQLYKNFRSRGNILSAVNFLFQGIMSERVGELDYTDEESLIYGAAYYEEADEAEGASPEDAVEILLVEDKESAENGEAEEGEEDGEYEGPEVQEGAPDPSDYKVIEMEAKMVADRINQLIRSGHRIYDNQAKVMRPMTYKDIVILMRATARVSSVFLEELHQANIPSFSDSSTGYFDTIEIRTMMALLNLIDNPLQDIPLLAVLRSPIFAFSEDELAQLRTVNPGDFLYRNLCQEEAFTGLLREKVAYFRDRLETYRNFSKTMKLDEFIGYLYGDTAYLDYVGAMPDGIERQANLRILFQRARQFEATSLKGLFNFIRFIDKLKRSAGDFGAAKILGENENLVRIMSIHKSKGLEFPVVFLVNTAKKFNRSDLRREVILHEELGIAPSYVDLSRNLKTTTLLKEVLKDRIVLESISEEMRVLYVAMTRAREKLILTGHVKELDKSLERWTRLSGGDGLKIGEDKVLKGDTYLDWIMAVLLKHQSLSAWRTDGKVMGLGKDIRLAFSTKTRAQVLGSAEELQEKPSGVFTLDLLEDPENAFEVNRRLAFAYAQAESIEKVSKVTVTELKRMAAHLDHPEEAEEIEKSPVVLRPKFLQESATLTGAERGTIFHKVMQHLDFQRVSLPEIRTQLQELRDRELLRPEELEAVNPYKIQALFQTKLGQRMQEADLRQELFRESKFLMNQEGSEVMVIGVIDVYFEEEGQLMLMDYKTDYLEESQGVEELALRYKEQLLYYKRALESITGQPVAGMYLYSVSLEKEIEISP